MFPLWNEISYTNTCCSWAWAQFITEICIKMILKELHTLWACLYGAFLRKQIHNQNKCPCLALWLILLQPIHRNERNVGLQFAPWFKETQSCFQVTWTTYNTVKKKGPLKVEISNSKCCFLRLFYREDCKQMHTTQVICTSMQPVCEKKKTKNPPTSNVAAESVAGHLV